VNTTQAVVNQNTTASEVFLKLPALSNVAEDFPELSDSAASQPDANGEFAAPADGAKFMASLGIPQVPLSAPTDTRFSNPGKNPAINGKNWQAKATTDFAQIDRWARTYSGCNFGSLAKSQVGGFHVLETDSPDLAQKYAQETGSQFQSGLIIESSAPGRNHRWYRHSSISLAESHNIGQDDARGFSLRCDDEQAVSPGSIHANGKQYRVVHYSGSVPTAQSVGELRWLNAQKPHSVPRTHGLRTLIPPGGHHNALLKELGSLIRRGYSKEAAAQALRLWAREWLESPGHGEPLEDHIRKMVDSSDDWERGTPADESCTSSPTEVSNPDRPVLDDAVFYGLAGVIIKKLEPRCESHPAGMLVEFMISFGNALGRSPYYQIDDTRHYTNEFMVKVGESSRARKGTGKDRVAAIMRQVDAEWLQKRSVSGIGSGEALIHQVRDPREVWFTNKKTGVGTWMVSDPGVADKRLCVSLGEFAGILAVCHRVDNLLPVVLRDSWDGKPLRNIVKDNPATSEAALVSIIADTTRDDLAGGLTQTDRNNGFANRFLWVYVCRTKLLPHGGGDIDWSAEVLQLQAALEFGRETQRMFMDKQTHDYWDRTIYPKLEREIPGLVGAITGRASAHTVRLAMLYALLDKSATIRLEHLKAAAALWQYCEDSVKTIFGDLLTPDQSKILDFIGGQSVNKTQIIHECFNKNRKADAIQKDLDVLVARKHIIIDSSKLYRRVGAA